MDKINKKFKPMMCPVCDGMYFSGPNKNSFDEDLKEYLNMFKENNINAFF